MWDLIVCFVPINGPTSLHSKYSEGEGEQIKFSCVKIGARVNNKQIQFFNCCRGYVPDV